MTATTLIDNFDLLAEAPAGVQKLREMILQLAVRGKLVPQMPGDANIHHEGHEEHEGSVDVAELKRPFSIPPHWRWTNLGSAVDYNYGEKVASQRIPSDAWLLDLEDIEKDTSRLLRRVLADDRQSTSTKSRFNAGDILFGKLRPYLNKVLVAESAGYCTTEIVPMKARKSVDPHYVVCALKSRDFLDYTAARSYGMKMPRLGTDDAKRAPFPLPPLAEQKRIVARVDELMKRCDELEARQNERNQRRTALTASCLHAISESLGGTRSVASAAPSQPRSRRGGLALQRITDNFPLLLDAPASVADLRKTILQLAVQGRLVPQDPKDELGSTLVNKIAVEKARHVRGRLRTSRAIAEEDILFDLPSNWIWSRLGDLCLDVTDGTHYTPKYTSNGIPFLSVKNLSAGQVDFSDTRFITPDEHATLSKRCRPEKGDILFTKVGTTGIAVAVDCDEEFSIFVSVALLKVPQTLIDVPYLTLALNSPHVKTQSERDTQGVGNKNLVLKFIREFTIPVPPLAEQKRIVAKVNELMALCDALETKLTKSREDAESLAAAIVHQVCNSSCGRLQHAVA